ncbi:hypothetical protein, partial [Burkholderia metallica]|uniref:hypothetical protein n=1 Tax=Burkholderia metallica TaxID=488729 RepID=UPI001A8D48C7
RAAAATAARVATASAAAARVAATPRRKHARAATGRPSDGGSIRPSSQTGACAPVFFRPAPHFTIRKIFLCRKKSCCVAQPARLRDGKRHFLSRNFNFNALI